MEKNEASENRRWGGSGSGSVSGPGSVGSVHQQLHLDQPGVGVSGHVVGNRPGEGDERSGLKAQLLFDQPTNRIS